MANLERVALVVRDYEPATRFFVDVLKFELVEDFDASYQRMVDGGVRFISGTRVEAYGKIAVFLDLEGNRWDLLGPDPEAQLG